MRARAWLAPFLNWEAYIERRWQAGHSQYQASRRLAEWGEPELARAAAHASFATCPTLYIKPARLSHLLRATLQKNNASVFNEARER
jgi:hypothetical protein